MEALVDFALAEKEEEDSIGGGDFVIVGAISGAIVGALALMRSGDCMINGPIPGPACAFLASRACSIVAALSFDLSIASCHIGENSDSAEEIADLAEEEERERRRLAGGGKAFMSTAIVAYSAGQSCRDVGGLSSQSVDEPDPA